ncbi:MAG: dihydrodipicolinate synthase family protein [Thermoplasmata archaeon]
MDWSGVVPAVTTPFTPTLELDGHFFVRHLKWFAANGIDAYVLLGSLGEGATLAFSEKCQLLELARSTVPRTGRLIVAISSLRTSESVALAKRAAEIGCDGLMVLPPYVYRGDWDEIRAHVEAILHATDLPAMLYNNPTAYGTDFQTSHIEELAASNPNLDAVKDSTGLPERIAELAGRLGSRLQLLVGIDEVVRPGVTAGAIGWVAGLANAMPRESVDLFRACREGPAEEARANFEWFLPLLRYDSEVKFVQRIKCVAESLGIGSSRVRAPRLELTVAERQETETVLRSVQARRPPSVSHSTPFPA